MPIGSPALTADVQLAYAAGMVKSMSHDGFMLPQDCMTPERKVGLPAHSPCKPEAALRILLHITCYSCMIIDCGVQDQGCVQLLDGLAAAGCASTDWCTLYMIRLIHAL